MYIRNPEVYYRVYRSHSLVTCTGIALLPFNCTQNITCVHQACYLRTGQFINLPMTNTINPSNAELNSICHLLAFLGAHHILHVSRIRVNPLICLIISKKPHFVPLFSQNNLWCCFWVGNSIHKFAPSSQETCSQ
jgi:hypothetical protein